jgi:hypothetical protein
LDTTVSGGNTVKQPHILLKVGVVVSSVLLAGACIAYRSGAFSRSTPPADPASAEQPPTEVAQPAPTLMPGSKSFQLTSGTRVELGNNVYTVEIGPYTPPTTEDPKKRLILPGSKSSFVFPPKTPATPPSSPAQPPAPQK